MGSTCSTLVDANDPEFTGDCGSTSVRDQYTRCWLHLSVLVHLDPRIHAELDVRQPFA